MLLLFRELSAPVRFSFWNRDPYFTPLQIAGIRTGEDSFSRARVTKWPRLIRPVWRGDKLIWPSLFVHIRRVSVDDRPGHLLSRLVKYNFRLSTQSADSRCFGDDCGSRAGDRLGIGRPRRRRDPRQDSHSIYVATTPSSFPRT